MANDNIEWTSEQMIENANNWSLAGDVAILNRLKKFSETFLSETETLNSKVDDMLNHLEYVSLKLDLTKNEFQSLKNTQFIENRVYEDDETLESDVDKKEVTKELTEEEKEDIIRRSIAKGLEVMKKYYDKVELAVSDSEGESNDKSYILQPKDPYIDRPLPYLVGSEEWYRKWHVGLLPSDSESESEKEEEVYSSSSDSEKYLPKNRVMGSETSSELDFINRSTGPVANSTFNDSQDPRRQVFHSSDDSSEQSSSLPVKTPISNEKFAEQLAAKLGDVISSKNESGESVTKASGRITQPQKYGNLFAAEPPPLDDSEETILPKSAQQGLFSGSRNLFAENSSDDLFWDSKQGNIGRAEDSPSHQKPTPYTKQAPSNQFKSKTSKGLFDETDSSSEEDMLTVTEKRKMMSSKTTNPYMQPYKTTVPFIDDQPPEIMPKAESGTSKKKPVGGVSVFGKNNDMLAANSRITEQESEKVSVTPSSIQQDSINQTSTVKKAAKKTSLFDESSDEEIFVPKPTKSGPKESVKVPSGGNKKLSLFDDSDEFPTKKPFSETKRQSFFSEQPNKEKPIDQPKNPIKAGLFDDDTTYQSLFGPASKENVAEPKTTAKKISLFDDDDDDDFLKEEEDIFAVIPKKKRLFGDLEDKPSKKIAKGGLFDDFEDADDLKINESSKKHLQNILGDRHTESTESRGRMMKDTPAEEAKVVKKPKSLLFEESDGSDVDKSSKEPLQNLLGHFDTGSTTNKKDTLTEEAKVVKKPKNLFFEESESSDVDDIFIPKLSVSKTSEDNNKTSEDSTISGTLSGREKVDKPFATKEAKDDPPLNFKEDKKDQAVTIAKDEDFKPKAIDIQQSVTETVSVTEDIKSEHKEKKAEFLRDIRKNVGIFGSESENSSEEENVLGKKKRDNGNEVVPPPENLATRSDEKLPVPEVEINLAEKSPSDRAPQDFSMPPPINLFDPTPPPVDWDASSDNSVESDRFSLTDGILERTNYNQSQPTSSSLFDEAPPSLDVNDINYSSGIIKDINVTRLENDDSSFNPHGSSFNPYASSSRRLSSDIFSDQQSQDSFFVTKNPSESQMHVSNLEKISESVTSKIENLTPSGNVEDFDGSGSVFEKTDENASVDDMDKTRSILDTNSKILQKVLLFDATTRPDVDDGGGKRSDTPPVKTSPGKLKNSLNINVGALLPGAAPPRTRPSLAKSTSLDETDKSSIIPEKEVTSRPSPTNRLIKQKSETLSTTQKATGDSPESGHFENIGGTEILHSVTKDRARIQVKRRPSTRKARREAVRKSLVEPDTEQPTVYEEPSGARNVDRETVLDKTRQKSTNETLENKSAVSPEIKGISLVFDKSIQENIKNRSNTIGTDLFDNMSPEGSPSFEEVIDKNKSLSAFDSSPSIIDDLNTTSKIIPKQTEKRETSSLFDDSFEDNDSPFKSATKSSSATPNLLKPDGNSPALQKPSTKADLFGATDSLGSSDEDLFSSASKLSNKPTPKPAKSSLFSDNSGSDSDSDLFGGKSKAVKPKPSEAAKKTSIFDDTGDSSEEDLFGSAPKSAKAGSLNTGASQSSKRLETKSAAIKKLENKEVTDFDPLSGFK